MADIQSTAAEIRRGKKKEERRTNHSMKIYMVSLFHRATINNIDRWGWLWVQLLMPLDIELHSSAPDGKNHHVKVVFLSDVVVNVSPAAIRTITATVSAIPPPKVGSHFMPGFCRHGQTTQHSLSWPMCCKQSWALSVMNLQHSD